MYLVSLVDLLHNNTGTEEYKEVIITECAHKS